jgi:hypothetical protein
MSGEMDNKSTKPRLRAKATDPSVRSGPSREFFKGLKLKSALGRDSHLGWVSDIVGKFGLKATRFWNSRMALIDLARSTRGNGAVHFHNGPSHHAQQRNYINVMRLHYNLFPGASADSLLKTSPAQISLRVSGVHRGFAIGRAGLGNTRNLIGAFRAERQLGYREETGDGPRPSDVITSRLKQTTSLRQISRAAALESVEETSLTHIVTHLARKHRRKEISKGEMGSEFDAPARAVFSRRIPEGEESVASQRNQPNLNESNIVQSTSTVAAPPPINVPQLTDEVMKQLDRKLVAARERMGRI